MTDIETLVRRSAVHPEWRSILTDALAAVDPDYLASLLRDEHWLPGSDRLLAAFQRNRAGLRYLLIGESPYPRKESANGIAFHDAAVGSLWSDSGLSKAVNRATSLRNLVKAAILAEGLAEADAGGRLDQSRIAALDKTGLVRTLGEFFDNLHAAGFLMLNATPVLHPARRPAAEARHWRGFLDRLLAELGRGPAPLPTLLLWGRIAHLVASLPGSQGIPRLIAEHPYNISFIDNPEMRALFADLRLLQRQRA